ncbi:tolloid-like protein 2 [Caerostris extrusa]|uniref:Tolloid-like protein 2 n=1 Tax=Caerostris extrusa TaxID=172846 RepID=A0AAV4V3V7_CAEEX|nr:tolloid-like protein 2 [Caerostris extrusa]
MESKLFEKKKEVWNNLSERRMILCLRSTGRCRFLKGGGKEDIIFVLEIDGAKQFLLGMRGSFASSSWYSSGRFLCGLIVREGEGERRHHFVQEIDGARRFSLGMRGSFASSSWYSSGRFLCGLIVMRAICGGDIIQEKGILHSPNYPEDYWSNKECTWRITVPENHQVALKFQSFEIENHDNCVYDYLGDTGRPREHESALGRFCGCKESGRHPLYREQDDRQVRLDRSVQKAGFAADFIKGHHSFLAFLRPVL